MKKPELAPEQLRGTKLWEYAVRFVFGGAITVVTGLIANIWGPLVAGLFLAFPAILPASMTLVKQHDGRRAALEDARGARLGSVGLAAFSATVAVCAGGLPAWAVLLAAAAMWALVDIGLWFLRYSKEEAA
ncbi:MAG TPA: hypothetical protein VMZ53_32140 [Kofleriaceae bacterium]|nr:hypothetical protein [Kofleriaceae bacterium]